MKANLEQMHRRQFISASLTGAAALTALGRAPAMAADPSPKAGTCREDARELPLVSDSDVIVCGAGPAGVTAAITAARAGAKVRIFEAHGSLGGVWTSSLLGYLLDFDKPGFNVELVKRLRERDAIQGEGMNGLGYQPEEMKLLLEELCSAAGVKMQPYDIPLRALIARDVDGLMMAGRCISGDFIAHASYRVTGNAVAMGEAASATAAVAVKNRTAPHDVPWSEVKPVIEKARRSV